jgi:type II secretory pathway component PulJ
MTRTPNARPRGGFTLPELLVAAAVCVLIMSVLATVFQAGIDTLRNLRSSGEMMDQLRAAGETLKRDLAGNHFQREDTKPNQGLRLSDHRLDLLTPSGDGKTFTGNWSPPRGGFFRIKSTPAFVEGRDQDNLLSTRATDHYLHFTSVLPGGTEQNLYTANVGDVVYTSPAAELAYFLAPIPTGYANNNQAVPLHNLIRRQRLVALTAGDQANLLTPQPDPGVISLGASNAVNTLADLANPSNRLGGAATWAPQPMGGDATLAPLGGARTGDDVLLSNVISFEVKVAWVPAPGVRPPRPFGTLNTATPGTFDNPVLHPNYTETTDHPYDHLPPVFDNASLRGQHLFDTWYAYPGWNSTNPRTGGSPIAHPVPFRARVMALQIKLRVYDPRMKNARQVTIVQDM